MAKVNNIWRWTAKDKKNNPVESAPGCTHFISRNPVSEAEMRQAGQLLLNSRMRAEWYAAGAPADWDCPDYRVDTVEPAGSSDGDDIGAWRPPGARPIAMPEPPVTPAE